MEDKMEELTIKLGARRTQYSNSSLVYREKHAFSAVIEAQKVDPRTKSSN